MGDDSLLSPRAAYVHVPFCRHRCGYCDFPLIAGRDDLIDAYLQALAMELGTVPDFPEIDTLFFGGGTPTHLPPDRLDQLFTMVQRTFRLAPAAEVSVEANPLDLDDERIAALVHAGVNRVSLGAQSLDANALAVLERDHQPDDVADVLARLGERGLCNRSIDLIFGVPGQSLQSWEQTLAAATTLPIEHVSTYGLTYEKGTSFWKRRKTGQLLPLDDETERSMYAAAMEQLPNAGFEQYELSNFARAGFSCRHNRVYWKGSSYYAFGPGAARYLGGVRSTNVRSVTTWLRRVLAGEPAVEESETLDDEQRARELVLLGLRQTAGIPLTEFAAVTGFDLRDLAAHAFDRFLTEGLIELADGRVRLTLDGRFLADTVIAEFL
ncbi:MAG: radical SAM family heme chaperone HemW [Planctomycetaceae bacterium]|nr:radical SAM family heme chaperone HemW [Planctomycetaceae bacterium]